ncbi:MAG: hypothetical protein U5L45_01400 [Saprospiraceae bacterium]|nr:hypothetical protein [Saprospiraceae bacterium]
MERQNAIKTLGLSLGSLISLPAWASSWQSSIFVSSSFLANNDALLAEIVDTIIKRRVCGYLIRKRKK